MVRDKVIWWPECVQPSSQEKSPLAAQLNSPYGGSCSKIENDLTSALPDSLLKLDAKYLHFPVPFPLDFTPLCCHFLSVNSRARRTEITRIISMQLELDFLSFYQYIDIYSDNSNSDSCNFTRTVAHSPDSVAISLASMVLKSVKTLKLLR